MAEPSNRDTGLAELAARQYGALTRAQAQGGGLTDKQVDYRIRAGRWRRAPARGVYVVAGSPDSHRRRASVALLASRPDAVLSHRTAAALHDLVEFPSAPVLTVGRDGAGRSPCATVHRGLVLPDDTVEVDGLRCTGVARTVVDLAAISSYLALTNVLDEVLTRELAAPGDIRAAVERARRAPGRRGEVALTRALEVWTPGPRPGSAPEMRLIRLLVDGGLPAPVRQHAIRDADGREVARVDLCWPEPKVIGEYDGRLFHGPRQAGHDADRQRRVEELGWRVVRVRLEDLRHPAALCARFRAALEAPAR